MLHITTSPDSLGLKSDNDIIVTGLTGTRFDKCSIGIVPEGESGRKVFQGPLVPGPWGFAVTHASVIDNSGLAYHQRARAIRIEVGKPFTVEGLPGVWMFRSPDRRKLEGDGPVLVAYEAGA